MSACSKNSAFKMFFSNKRVWFSCTPTWSDTGYKNDVSRAKRSTKRDHVRRAIWPRGVTHCVYNDRRCTRIQIHMRRHTHVHWILPHLSAYTCKNCQRAHHVRMEECRRFYARSLGFASANSSYRITTRQIRIRSSS